MSRVRKAEEEAESIRAAALRRQVELVKEARLQGKALLAAARDAAAGNIAELEKAAARETRRLVDDLARTAAEEEEKVRGIAAGNLDDARTHAVTLLRRMYFRT
jgi:hypothetical protein